MHKRVFKVPWCIKAERTDREHIQQSHMGAQNKLRPEGKQQKARGEKKTRQKHSKAAFGVEKTQVMDFFAGNLFLITKKRHEILCQLR